MNIIDRLNELDNEELIVLQERPRYMKSILSDIAIEREELETLLEAERAYDEATEEREEHDVAHYAHVV